MTSTRLALGLGACAIATLLLGVDPLGGQSPAPSARTIDGHPDLQGVWNFGTVTPLERPAAYADKAFLEPDEVAAFEQRMVAERNKVFGDDRPDDAAADLAPGYNQFWYDWGSKAVKTRRTSLIVDPSSGRLPPLTEHGERRRQERMRGRMSPPGGPEDFTLADRCIIGFNSMPMLPSAYNNLMQLIQSRDTVVIYNEMIHFARLVTLGARAELPAPIRQYAGHSRGYWDGEMLVVETGNFTDHGIQSLFLQPATDANVKLTERFSRTDADTLMYRFTVEDATIWTQPWTVELPMHRVDERVYEYACHEGNYALANILSAVRAEERAGALKSGGR
jgi:hypothetical protein